MLEINDAANAQAECGGLPSGELLPALYEELRKLAAVKLARENPGQTLQATALVHEAYLRLAGGSGKAAWTNRAHFFAAAAEAMRQILIERARRKATLKHGGEFCRVDLDCNLIATGDYASEQLLVLNEALADLERHDSQAANVVKLRFFAGLTLEETANALEISLRTTNRTWAVAKAWLYRRIRSF